jgi:hypothetical protein
VQAPVEFATGETLESVLDRHLAAVESSADTILLTSILLLDDERRRLRHAAGPSLPASYCDAIDGSEIGPNAGSCGTAAFFGHAIYVTDIATDPLWTDYRDVALTHGLRACWSTPIRGARGEVAGTFAIYHLTPRSPTREEVAAIAMIADHVAQAIDWSRGMHGLGISVEGDDHRSAGTVSPDELLHAIGSNFEKLAEIVEREIGRSGDGPRSDEYLASLVRVRDAARRGAGIVRKKSSDPH